ncbi:hexose transporter hxt1 [Tulasnella sp. 331]|nr:hexose transporter hxt1 [Tulasnella sp. 331]KAG8878139.1 hexose transporter hxt1 [Tulasnella sp. 332]
MQIAVRGQRISGQAILVAIVASTGGFLFGYDTGQISGILIMPDFLRRFATCSGVNNSSSCAFNTWIEGLIVAFLSIGTAIGALIGAKIAEVLGRRKAMSVECAVVAVGTLIRKRFIVFYATLDSAAAKFFVIIMFTFLEVVSFHAWYQIGIGRFVTGLGIGALSAAVPVYQAETAPKVIRGTLTATYQLMITAGILLAALINLGTHSINNSASWRITVSLNILFSIMLGTAIMFCPESPRWLLQQGRGDEARRSIEHMYGSGPDAELLIETEYRDMSRVVATEQSLAPVGWSDIFVPRNKTLYRTALGMTLQMFQQLTGANYFFYYGATIFQGVGLTSPYVTQTILNSVNFVCTFLGLYVMERFGRRNPLIIGGIWQGCWMIVFATVGTTKDPTTDKHAAQVLIISGCMFILGYASTWAPGVWILIGETFANRTRPRQGAMSTFSNWVWNFLLAFFTTPIVQQISFKYGYIFGGCNLAGALIVFLFLYESSGLTLEAVDVMYNDPNAKPWTSGSWAPPGFTDRYHFAKVAQQAPGDEMTMVGSGSDSEGPSGVTGAGKTTKKAATQGVERV